MAERSQNWKYPKHQGQFLYPLVCQTYTIVGIIAAPKPITPGMHEKDRNMAACAGDGHDAFCGISLMAVRNTEASYLLARKSFQIAPALPDLDVELVSRQCAEEAVRPRMIPNLYAIISELTHLIQI
jgi:hypothetical protein